MRSSLRLVVGAFAVLVVAASAYLFSKSDSTAPLPTKNTKLATPADTSPKPEAVPLPINWSTLEPAYKNYKIQVGNDNSLQTEQQAIEFYGVTILPRSQICNYRSGERWACGQRAYIALLNVLGGATVDCRPSLANQPRIVVCRIGGSDIAELILREGWGNLGSGVTDKRYVDAAAAAFTNKTGMWTLQASITKN